MGECHACLEWIYGWIDGEISEGIKGLKAEKLDSRSVHLKKLLQFL